MDEKLVMRLESAVARLEAISLGGLRDGSSHNASEEIVDQSLLAYDELMDQFVARLSSIAQKIGGQVLQATRLLEEAFLVHNDLLLRTKQIQKPDISHLVVFLKPLNDVIAKTCTLTEGKRSEVFNHLKAVADSLTALAWLAYSGKDSGMSLPAVHVEESWQMAEFYNNKILVEFKNKDQNHVEWAKALKAVFLPGLREFVKKFYPLGPPWNPNGQQMPTQRSEVIESPAPAVPPHSSNLNSSPSKKGMAAVFEEINSGKSISAGLRKVSNESKAKNYVGRTGLVTEGVHSATRSKSKPPKLELQMGRKWVVENQIGQNDLIIDKCSSKQSVYVYGCDDSILQVKGKVNNITVDRCNKMGILFEDVVSACEIVNCERIEVQCQGSAPTIAVDNTAGCQLYLSKESLGASITTAKSSEVNVLVPGLNSSGDWVEHSLPQQFVHIFKDGRYMTSPVLHTGD